jgi:hypothetical protein
MNSKDQIKVEIYNLAQKISKASSDRFMLETAREIYENAALLKYAPDTEIPPVLQKEEPASAPVKEELPKPTTEPIAAEQKQATIDLFSAEPRPEPTPGEKPVPVSEKPAIKEKKEPKKKSNESVAEKLQHNKITDLKASIGINEKFQFINQLFEGNMKEYTVAIDQINSFTSLAEAESYLANLEEVYKWKEDNQVAGGFKELVERRFS